MECVRADEGERHDQDPEVADDRNDESGADVSLQSDHAECKSISPQRTDSIYHPPKADIPNFYWQRVSRQTGQHVVTTELDPVVKMPRR